ncbi:MAG TPA: magnesium transporter CorA family protein [Verrucomicrobiae bacterium]|nr:magnesium transporter CorA family protein [Verrucomicrobiae bacterium]
MLRKLDIVGNRLTETEADDARVLLYIAPTEEETRHLVSECRIDAHTLASALDPDELGRLEFEPDHAAIIVKRPKQYSSEDNFLFKITSVGVFLFREKLILVVAEDTLRFEGKQFQNVRSLTDIILKMIFRCIHHFEEHLRVFSMISDELERKINTAMENRHLLNMFTLGKSLVYYLNAISSNGRVMDKIKTNAQRLGLTPEDVEFLDDVLIENNQCRELANTYSQVLSSLMDARVSVVSNNLNVLMKALTLVMISIMMPTLVISVFSMNVKLPMDQEGSMIPFWFIVALATASGAAVLLLWKHKRL